MPQSTIRILHVIAHLEKGGAEKQLQLLARHSRHDHTIAVPAWNAGPSAARIEPLETLSFSGVRSRIGELIAGHSIQIVQLWLPPRLTIPAAFAARSAKTAIISGDRRKPRSRGKGAIMDRLGYFPHLAADVIVPNYPVLPPSFGFRSALRLAAKTRVIPNGLDLEPRFPDDTAPAPSRLLFVGRLIREKRVDLLLEAVSRPALRSRIASLDIVGEGPLGSELETRARELGIGEIATFHGRLTDWHDRFDPAGRMLVLPSTSEGMSNTLLEAIAAGLFPIVTDSPELRAILSRWEAQPLYVEGGSVEALASGIDEALGLSREALHSRIRAMQAGLAQFGVAPMVDAYDALYERLTG